MIYSKLKNSRPKKQMTVLCIFPVWTAETMAGLWDECASPTVQVFVFKRCCSGRSQTRLAKACLKFIWTLLYQRQMLHSSRGALLAQVIMPCYRHRGWPISLVSPVTLGSLSNLKTLRFAQKAKVCFRLKVVNRYNITKTIWMKLSPM